MHAVAAIVDAPLNSEFNLLTPEQSSGPRWASTSMTVMMTSFAFILGLLPLVIAQGVGALARQAVGTALSR